ncbi:MAG: hypothetical protein WC433_08085 [Candidatus Omnitrophota bacterium]|jgi:hypothetical protein
MIILTEDTKPEQEVIPNEDIDLVKLNEQAELFYALSAYEQGIEQS